MSAMYMCVVCRKNVIEDSNFFICGKCQALKIDLSGEWFQEEIKNEIEARKKVRWQSESIRRGKYKIFDPTASALGLDDDGNKNDMQSYIEETIVDKNAVELPPGLLDMVEKFDPLVERAMNMIRSGEAEPDTPAGEEMIAVAVKLTAKYITFHPELLETKLGLKPREAFTVSQSMNKPDVVVSIANKTRVGYGLKEIKKRRHQELARRGIKRLKDYEKKG